MSLIQSRCLIQQRFHGGEVTTPELPLRLIQQRGHFVLGGLALQLLPDCGTHCK